MTLWDIRGLTLPNASHKDNERTATNTGVQTMSDLAVLACVAIHAAILWAVFYLADPYRD